MRTNERPEAARPEAARPEAERPTAARPAAVRSVGTDRASDRRPVGPLALPSTLSTHDRRRLGAGLLAFGVAGLVILVAAAAFVLASLGSLGPTGGDVQAQVAALDRSLDQTSATLGATKAAMGNLTGSVSSAATSARGASDLAAQLATTMHDVSAAMNLSILGSRPFASLGGEFDQVGIRSTAVAGQLQSLAGSLDSNATDLANLAGQIDSLQTSIGQLRAAVGPGSVIGGVASTIAIARALLLAMVVWLAIPAVVATWLGARIVRRESRGPGLDAAPRDLAR